jgi:hypothetical protein
MTAVSVVFFDLMHEINIYLDLLSCNLSCFVFLRLVYPMFPILWIVHYWLPKVFFKIYFLSSDLHQCLQSNHVNKTRALLQTTWSKDEPNIVLCGNRNWQHNTELRHGIWPRSLWPFSIWCMKYQKVLPKLKPVWVYLQSSTQTLFLLNKTKLSFMNLKQFVHFISYFVDTVLNTFFEQGWLLFLHMFWYIVSLRTRAYLVNLFFPIH